MTAIDKNFHSPTPAPHQPFTPSSSIPRSTVQAAIEYIRSLIPSAGAAPADAQYLVAVADGTLTAERVPTNTATVEWDFATAAQAKANVPNDAITFAKMQNIATDRLLGRDTASSGDPEEISVGGGLEFTGGPGIGIADNGVSDAKLRDSAAVSVIGRSANSSGDPADIAAASNDTLLRRVSDAVGFGALTLGMAAANLWTYAKLQQVSATSRILGRKTAGAGDIEECTLSEVLDFIGSAAKGDILYRNTSSWARLPIGTDNHVLKVNVDVPNWEAEAGGSVAAALEPCGRLTLVTATPVLTSDQSAITTIYYTPFEGNEYSYYDGSAWARGTFTELSLALNSNSGHTGYHQSGKIFPVFLDHNGGTPRIVTGPAWTNDTTRADALTILGGLHVNNASITVRFGTGAGDTVSKSANTLVHIGDFRATADGQASFTFGGSNTAANLLVWNRYRRRQFVGQADEPTNGPWSVTAGTTSAYNSNNNIRVNVLNGENDMPVSVLGMGFCAMVSTEYGQIKIGLDSTSAQWGQTLFQPAVTGATVNPGLYGYGAGNMGLGFHYLQLLQCAVAGDVDFYGDNGTPDNQKSGIMVTAWA